MTPAERAACAAYQIGWLVVRRIPEPRALDIRADRGHLVAPATLAVHTGAALMPVTLWFEGRGWRAHVYPEIPVLPDGTRAQNVAAMTQQLATVWQDAIAEHPQDWHMMQKVFAADLDAAALPAGTRPGTVGGCPGRASHRATAARSAR